MIKLVIDFFDPIRNDEKWWDTLMDRIPKIEKRKWIITSGGTKNYGSAECQFYFEQKQNEQIDEQELFNEVFYYFILSNTNLNSVWINDQDVTKLIVNR